MAMSNARDPFEVEDGFEDIPVVQKPVQAVNKVANTVVKQTAQQVKATTKAFISQLYGTSSTDDDEQADAAADPMAQVQKTQTGQQTPASAPLPQQAAHHASSSQSTQTSQSDQAKLEQARRELQQAHRSSYYVPTFGDIGHLESEIQKEAQKRQQEEQQKEQEEEQEKQQMEQLEEQKKKEDVPLAVKQARTKSERRPGAG